jgi:uncharacterized glyoxalase superfamily protein PhnB
LLDDGVRRRSPAADLRARFWGMRYAQVKDPDGNIVDLFADL